MKVKSLKSHGLFTFSVMFALASISSQSMADRLCSISALAGSWSYYEQGELNNGEPWSELGSFTLDSSGNGSGVAIITASQSGLINVRVPILSTQILTFDDTNCVGTASFTVPNSEGGTDSRTISFSLRSKSAFSFISTTGDLTVVGQAKKRVRRNEDEDI